MQPDTFRTLAEYIHELRRRDRDRDRTGQSAPFDTTVEDDANWNQGNRGGDGRRSKDHQG